MNENQVTEFAFDTAKDIAALWESAKSAHKRIDENDKITDGIHELAKNIASMATQIKLLTEKLDKSVERMELGQKSQGERIGSIERMMAAMELNSSRLEEHDKRIKSIEQEPADRWKSLVSQVIQVLAAAVAGGIIAGLF